jgi:hypothetical protein
MWVVLSISCFFWLSYLVWYQHVQALYESDIVSLNLGHIFITDVENLRLLISYFMGVQ